MASIADVWVTVAPETSKVASGIKRVFRELDDDAAEAGRRWGNEIQRGIGKVKVDVDADTSKATAQIDAMSRDRKATVEVDADTLGASVQRGISQGGEAGISALQPALLGIGVTMAAGVASALSGLAALLPAGIAGAGGVIGTLALGLDGVKDAWDAAGKAAQSSGQDQANQAREVTAAQRGLKDAVQSEEQAQKDVANARKDALTQLRDLNLELRGGALDEKQAQLDALKARQDLATGRYKTAIDYAQAQLRVQEADQRVAEAHQRNIDLQTKAADAQRKGVDGADQVVAANQRLAKAQEQVGVAQENLDRAASKQSSSVTALSQAMANLSPNAQAFVESLRGVKPIFDQLKFSVQDSLLAGLGPVIQNLATTYLPILQQGLGSLAGTMNQAFGQFAAFMTQPQTMAAMQQIFANIGSSFAIWAQSLQPVSQAFLTITQVGSGFLPQLAQMMVNAGNAFNQFIQQAASSGQLQQWIQTGITALSQLGQMLSTLGPMFLQLAPIGTATLGAINQLLTSLAPAIAPLSGLFASMITEMTPGLGILGQMVSTLVVGLAPAFTSVFNAMAPVAQQFAAILGPVLAQLAPVLAQMSAQIGTELASAIQQLTPQLVPLVEQFAKLLEDAIPLLPQLMNFGQSVLPLITQALSLMIPWTTQMLTWIDKLVEKVPNLISPLLGLANALDSIGNKVSWLVGPLGKLLSLDSSTPYPAGPPATTPLPSAAAPPPVTPGLPSYINPNQGPTGVYPGATWTPGPGQAPMTWVPGKGWQKMQTPAAPAVPAVTPSSAVVGGSGADAALLSRVPAGRYETPGQGNVWDLTKGLADCSSAVEDLVNMMDGRPTGGRSMSTGNEASWLLAHGFLPTDKPMPGTFQVGFSSSHTQATLPGGTNFNWGSDAAAAAAGRNGTGAWDPSFTQHFYRPTTPGSMPAMPAVTPGPTGAQNDPYYMQYPDGYKPPGPDMSQFGQNIGSDLWDMFLPEGFKNPMQFGGVKFGMGLLNGLLGLQLPTNSIMGGDGASLPVGGGGDLLGGILSNVPQAFGALKIGAGPDAPGQFMPTMPDQGGANPIIPGDVMNSKMANTAVGGQPIDNRIDMRGAQIGLSASDVMQHVDAKQNARARQPLRALPGQG